MKRAKKKLTTKSKSVEKSDASKKQVESASTRKKTDQPSHRCRPKQKNSSSAETNAGASSVEISAKQIDPNSPEADAAVMRSLLEMAISGKNITATIFWAKVRCGMHEKGQEKARQVSQSPTIVIRTEKGKQA